MGVFSDRFHVGCNYWASHAGTGMWRDWREEVVREDLRQLAALGLRTLRVFPLWSDFQPLEILRQHAGHPREYRLHGEPLGTGGLSAAGIDPVMFERFGLFAAAAHECGIGLIPGLVTGWMSGRFFAPPALAHLNAIADPESIRWQVRFVREFVRAFRACEAVVAWDLGNECNCMGEAGNAQAWAWTHAIAAAIRVEDPSRPVVSGMHSLAANAGGSWSIRDQAELTDVLTTHPYPLFTPGCDLDPLDSLRPALHAAAESSFYADLGGKPCLVEEIGTLGPEVVGERAAADYARVSLYSSWAHGHLGFLWWCAYDQTHLEHAPYDWNAVERELGILRTDRSAKPVAGELQAFAALLDSLPFAQLPPRLIDAVCVVTRDQDAWRMAYSSFVLAKQAGLDIRFAHVDQPLPEAPIYLVPCTSGHAPMSRARWLDLIGRVKRGATLYLSHHDGILSLFRETTGMEVLSRSRGTQPVSIVLPGPSLRHVLTLSPAIRQVLAPAGAEVLASDSDGHPVFSQFRLGQGEVFYLAVPLELHAAHTPGFFAADAPPAWTLYRTVAESRRQARAVPGTSTLGVTEHPATDGSRVIVQINYDARPAAVALPAAPWKIARWFTPQTETIPSFGAAVFEVGCD